MASYEHACQNTDCNFEWESNYSVHDKPPTTCPKCLQETAKRMISLGSKGVVLLTGNDLKEKCLADAQKMKAEIYTNANKYANFIGEDRYQDIQSKMDKRNR